MASAEESEFLARLETARREVREKFSQIYKLLREREDALLSYMQEVEDSYKQQKLPDSEQRRELLVTKKQTQDSLKGNANREILQSVLSSLDRRLTELEEREHLRIIDLNWGREGELYRLLKDVRVIKLFEEIDYTKKVSPVLVACQNIKNDKSPGVFNWPTVIAIHPITYNLYVIDSRNYRIQVFNESCDFLFSFSQDMIHPVGICFCNNQVYVTQYASNTCNVYTSAGDYTRSFGRKGVKELEFNGPARLCFSESWSLMYICERNNNRVQVLNSDLSFNSFIAGLSEPTDINVTSSEVYILDNNNPCLHVYNSKHQLVWELISFGKGCQVISSFHFCVDNNSNILFTDTTACCVVVFNKKGELIHRFGRKGMCTGEFVDPRGIVIDSKQRVIVVSQNTKHCVQFF